jgi:hypothetical protein
LRFSVPAANVIARKLSIINSSTLSRKGGGLMERKAQSAARYEAPVVVDYGSLVELTAQNGMSEAEDGLGKVLHTDGSSSPSAP